MEAIVAVDKNWAIGNAGRLLQPIREDLKRFKQLTTGKLLIYGRKTLDTFPGQKPLPKRRNLVLTRHPENFVNIEIETFSNINDLLKNLSMAERENSFVIGGSSIYLQLLPFCDRVYVTEIDHAFAEADSYFPNLLEDSNWRLKEQGPWLIDGESQMRFRYLLFERVRDDGE